MLWRATRSAEQAATSEGSGLKKSLDDAKAAAPMKANDVVKNFGGAVVKIERRLEARLAAGQGLVYHQYMNVQGQPRPSTSARRQGRAYLTYNTNP